MFFRKKKPDPRQAAFNEVCKNIGTERECQVDAAIVLIHATGNDAILQLLQALTSNQVFAALKIPNDLSSACVAVQNETGYIALFSTFERVNRFLDQQTAYRVIQPLAFMSPLFDCSEKLGVILNPEDDHITLTLSPANLKNFRLLVRGAYKLPVGGYYWINQGKPQVVKLLARDEQGVHVRLYSDPFPDPPVSINPSILNLDNKEGEKIRAIGHMPLSIDHFLAWAPKLIQEGEVTEEELEGFHLWKKAKGGYF